MIEPALTLTLLASKESTQTILLAVGTNRSRIRENSDALHGHTANSDESGYKQKIHFSPPAV